MSDIIRQRGWNHAATIALLLVLCFQLIPATSRAQEAPAAEEESSSSGGPYAELRKSKKRSTQLLAERYFALVRTQEWTDASGKKVVAKYKSHDPDMQWVMLEVARGRGADRTVKEYKFPVARLGKSSQSRVKQIDAVQKRLDEELAKPADDPNNPGSSMTDEVGEEPRSRRTRTRATEPEEPAASETATETVEPPVPNQPAAVEEPFDPDPLGFGEMGIEAATTSPEAGASLPPSGAGVTPDPSAVPDPTAGGMQAKLLDSAPWRRDYEAFRTSFQSDGSQELLRVKWGKLTTLREAADEVMKHDSVGAEEHAIIAKKFDAVGEVIWEATLTDAEVDGGDWTDRLNLPALPEPLTISFLLDEERPQGDWQSLKAGDKVRFIGRFVDYEHGDLIVGIRFPPQN